MTAVRTAKVEKDSRERQSVTPGFGTNRLCAVFDS